jgi:nucleoside-diphosphate-sugar epimerase
MTILVTGAAGFLGRECVRQLKSAGHDLVTTDKRGAADFIGDLADEPFCRSLPDVDTVVHSAAVQYFSPDLPLLNRSQYFHRNNVVATRNLTERYFARAAHFVNVGTSMMYEQSGRELYDVACPMRGQGTYSASKIEANAFVSRMPNRTACVIPCIIGGGGRGGLFQSLVTSMLRLGTVIYPGKGTHKVHIVHVEDAAALIRTVIEKRATGLFNAASSDPLTIADWVSEIVSELKLDRIRTIKLPLLPVELASAVSAHRLLAREQLLMLRLPHVLSIDEGVNLGWKPRHSNAEIVRETARALAREIWSRRLESRRKVAD